MKRSPTPSLLPHGDAEIYRNAAKLLEDERTHCGCCKAISDAGGEGYLPSGAHALHMDFYYPEGMRGEWGDYGYNKARILALCFLAAMAEAGDL